MNDVAPSVQAAAAERTDRAPRRVLLLGAYGQRNIGDDALLTAFVHRLGAHRIAVNSATPDETAAEHGVAAVRTYRGRPRLTRLRAVLGADVIVFGGGSLLKDIEGGAVRRAAYQVRLLSILAAARVAGIRTVMHGIGVGPLDSRLSRAASRLACRLANTITVRDADSADTLAAIGVARAVPVVPDPVFDLPLPATAPATAPYAVVVPRYSLSPAALANLAAVCDRLAAAGLNVAVVPFQTGWQAAFDDLAASRAVADAATRESVSVVVPHSVEEAMRLVGGAAVVVSSRLHGLILATAAGVPSVAVAYDPKMDGFMRGIGRGDATVSPTVLGAGPDALNACVDRTLRDRTALAAKAEASSNDLRAASRHSLDELEATVAEATPNRAALGAALLFASMTLVNLGNYVFNLVFARWLGPSSYADIALVVTLLLTLTFATASLQLTSARFTARGSAADGDAVRRALGRWAVAAGVALGALCVAGSPALASFFRTSSVLPFALLGAALPLYLAMGVHRGALQGRLQFVALSMSYQAEMWVRLLGAAVLVALGLGTAGAVGGLTASIVAAWYVARRSIGRGGAAPAGWRVDREVQRFAGAALLTIVGQILIGNSDVLIVKHAFSPAEAGGYAAVAVVGRIVFFAASATTMAMFPMVARRQRLGQPTLPVMAAAMAAVAAISLPLVALTAVAPDALVGALFGPSYAWVAPLLLPYAVASALYSLASVAVTHRLALGDVRGSLLALGAGVAQGALLLAAGTTLGLVVGIQVALMGLLVVTALALELVAARRRSASPSTTRTPVVEGALS